MLNIHNITPESFRELLSSVTFLVGIAYSLLSLIEGRREHCLRMTALFLLVSLALFANNPYCYFATLFIVATAVTQLEFLQNLAAIIRGSKEYFDYRKEFLSQREVEKTLEKEVEEIEAAPIEVGEVHPRKIRSFSIGTSNMTAAQFGLLVEQNTFALLEKKYGKPIQRYVRYKGKQAVVEFDGVMQTDSKDMIFEIKTSRRDIPLAFLMSSVEQYIEKVHEYQEITKRPASLQVVLVGNLPSSILTAVELTEKVLAQNVEVAFNAYTFEDIGLSDLKLTTR
jgi:hypothetical protein